MALSIVVPGGFAFRGYRKGSVSLSGLIFGLIVGISMVLSNMTTLVALITCFQVTSTSTKYREDVKKLFEVDYKEGGQRNWVQVMCNVGVPSIFILFKLIHHGIGEIHIDFVSGSPNEYCDSWLVMASICSIASALGDTLSSELGPVWAEYDQPLLITTLKPVPKGTNGGVTIAGLIAATLGGATIGVASFVSQLLFASDPIGTHHYSPQWPIILYCAWAGLFGSIIDSFLGATLQYSGYDHFQNKLVAHPPSSLRDDFGSVQVTRSSNYVEHITGIDLLDNHTVNLVSVTLTGVLVACLASWTWPSEHFAS